MSIVNDKPTPETDAFMTRIRGIDGDKHWVPADTAKRLERERDEAREENKNLKLQLELWEDGNLICEGTLGEIRLLEERIEEAQKELSSIHRWIDKNHADGFIDSLTYLQNLERVTDSWYDRIDGIEADARRFVRERDEAREDLESEKNTRNAIIEKGLKLEKQLRKWVKDNYPNYKGVGRVDPNEMYWQEDCCWLNCEDETIKVIQ